jgi:hypothetical protein
MKAVISSSQVVILQQGLTLADQTAPRVFKKLTFYQQFGIGLCPDLVTDNNCLWKGDLVAVPHMKNGNSAWGT